MTSQADSLTVSAGQTGTLCLLTVDGVLTSATYRALRDIIIEAALNEPAAVLINVERLDVPASCAWSVFTSAHWHVSTWPGVPIGLVCADSANRKAIARSVVARHIPVFATLSDAATLGAGRRMRRRARSELPAALASLRHAREFVAEWLTEWGYTDLIPSATIVANVLVENVLQHTESAPVLQVEAYRRNVTVSVRDGSSVPAARHEDPHRGGQRISGLAIIASVSRAWGCAPTPTGKTVWAVVGPEHQS